MGFVPLYHVAGEMVVLLRAGRNEEAVETYKHAKYSYTALIDAIRLCEEDAGGIEE